MKETKRGRGRPPKPPGEGKDSVFQIRLSWDEREDYLRAAGRASMTMAAWIRDRLTKAAKRESKRD